MPLNSYLAISRLDNIPKHIFILPGIFLAMVYSSTSTLPFFNIFLGIICSILSASSNYVINEYLDSKFDKFHPLKKKRVLIKGKIVKKNILFYYIFLVLVSLLISSKINIYFFYTNIFFLISGIIYNLHPFRLKERIYLDVINESLNNPIRLFLGWFMIFDNLSIFPPISFILFYWFTGAFLMSAKRLSEVIFFQKFSNRKKLILYRKNYEFYNRNNITVICIIYLMLLSFNSAIFLLKYREELILLYPIITLLFSTYFYLSIQLPTKAIFPEKIYFNKYIIILTIISFSLFFILFYYDIPIIKILVQKTIFY